MKKILALLLAAMLLISCAALAEQADRPICSVPCCTRAPDW